MQRHLVEGDTCCKRPFAHRGLRVSVSPKRLTLDATYPLLFGSNSLLPIAGLHTKNGLAVKPHSKPILLCGLIIETDKLNIVEIAGQNIICFSLINQNIVCSNSQQNSRPGHHVICPHQELHLYGAADLSS